MSDCKCVVCGKEVKGYEAQFCCSGRECGCRGLPIEPPLCSKECGRKAYGIPSEQEGG